MPEISHIGVLGAGVIGASWAALFLAAGRRVSIYDPSPSVEEDVRAYIERAWPTLEDLGLTARAGKQDLHFMESVEAAVEGVHFVQENVPERADIKRETYRAAEKALAPDAILSSSTSGMTLTALQDYWEDPSPLILGHPFNPPHLIPLVELTANAKTGKGILERTEAFYKDIGKVTIRIKKGLPGHVANRLQAAIWREAVYMAVEGVASVEDIDKAMWSGPGLRWAAMGPTSLFHLGAGERGLQGFCDHFKDTFHAWWDGLGDVRLTDAVIEELVLGMEAANQGASIRELSDKRDALIVAMQKATKDLRTSGE